MRIALFCPTVSGKGGMESAIRNLMAGFSASGDTTRLFLFGGSYEEEWLNDLSHTKIGDPTDLRITRFAKYALGAMRVVTGWMPDAIICADGTTIQMARLGRLFAGNRKIPIASWLHFPLREVRLSNSLPKVDLHLAISAQIAEDLRALMPSKANRITTIYNATRIGESSPLPRPETPTFLYAGRLTFNDHKRVNDILLAVAGLRGSWKLKIIGSAPIGQEEYLVQLKELARSLCIEDRIEWMGWQSDPWKAAGGVTALISSSAREAFAMVLIEACSYGIACVASACSGNVEVIIPQENGWLFPVSDVEQMRVHLQNILDDPSILPSQTTIRNTALRFSPELVAQRARRALIEANSSAA